VDIVAGNSVDGEGMPIGTPFNATDVEGAVSTVVEALDNGEMAALVNGGRRATPSERARFICA